MTKDKLFLEFVANVSKRCGISRPTLEVAIPAVFDEIRQRLCEGDYPCMPIESFGTFAVIEVPERDYLYNRKGIQELRKLPPKKRLKFSPTNHMRGEVEQGKFDPTRQAFEHHPDDTKLRCRSKMRYRGDRGKSVNVSGKVFHKSTTTEQ